MRRNTQTSKAVALEAARRQAYLVIIAGLIVALVGLVLAIIAGQVAQAVSLAAGVVAVLGFLVVAIVVERRRARRRRVNSEVTARFVLTDVPMFLSYGFARLERIHG